LVQLATSLEPWRNGSANLLYRFGSWFESRRLHTLDEGSIPSRPTDCLFKGGTEATEELEELPIWWMILKFDRNFVKLIDQPRQKSKAGKFKAPRESLYPQSFCPG
jgi:hypothetical protein